MSVIHAELFFTFYQEEFKVYSQVVVETSTGEFDGQQAFDDMWSLTEEITEGPKGQYLEFGGHLFEFEMVPDGKGKYRVIDQELLEHMVKTQVILVT